MTVEAQYSQDGLRITVNDMIKDPLLIPYRFQSLSANQFVMEEIFRQVPGASAGVLRFEKESPLFAQNDPEAVAEGGEIPLTQIELGEVDSAYTVKHGSGIEITREMRSRGRTDLVNRQMNQVRNTFVRLYENKLKTALDNAITNVVTADNAWDTSSATHRDDLFSAMEFVTEATDSHSNPLGFSPDTVLISQTDKYHLLRSETFADIYKNGNIADRNIRYTGKLENQILGLDVLASRFLPSGRVYVLERNTLGGWSDEYPLNAEPLEREARRQAWYSLVTRSTAIFVDQPKATAAIDTLT